MNYRYLKIAFLPLLFISSMLLSQNKADFGDKRFNEITLIGTHNSQSYKETNVFDLMPFRKMLLKLFKIDPYVFNISNQAVPINEQLEKYGVRNLHLAIHPIAESGSEPYLCHGYYPSDIIKYLNNVSVPRFFKSIYEALIVNPVKQFLKSGSLSECFLDPAAQPLVSALCDIKAFLDANPNEIVSIDFGGTLSDPDVIANNVQIAGLVPYAHAQNSEKPWPTYRQMIHDGKRLVIFINKTAEHYPWLNNKYRYSFTVGYGFKNIEQLQNIDRVPDSQKSKSGYIYRHIEPKNSIFHVAHSVTPLIGGSKYAAEKANSYDFLKTRIDKLIADANVKPHVILFDFVNIKNEDIRRYVNQLNG